MTNVTQVKVERFFSEYYICGVDGSGEQVFLTDELNRVQADLLIAHIINLAANGATVAEIRTAVA